MNDLYLEDDFLQDGLDTFNFVLRHHGIKGQSWGVRNGPPYPLDLDAHNAKENHAHWKTSLTKARANKGINMDSKGNPHTEILDNERNILGQSFSRSGMSKRDYYIREISSKKNDAYGFTDREYSSYILRNDEETFANWVNNVRKALDSGMSEEEVERMYNANPGVTPHYIKPGWKDVYKTTNPGYGEPGTTNNCPFVGAAAQLRAMGYNVIARRSFGGAAATSFESWFKGAQTEYCEDFDELKNDILKDGDGASGVLQGYYGDGLGSGHGGHTLNWRNEGGNVIISDCQSHEEMSYDEMLSNYGFGKGCFRTRLDNTEPNWDAISADNVVGIDDDGREWEVIDPDHTTHVKYYDRW